MCRSMRQQTHNGKPIPSLEELADLQDQERRSQINREQIQIIDDTYCVCQLCKKQVKMLPDIQLGGYGQHRASELQRELRQLKIRRESWNKGEIQLSNREIATLKQSIQWRQKELYDNKEKPMKIPLEKRLPLYRRGEMWVCGRCLV
jgi:hypothetical protein